MRKGQSAGEMRKKKIKRCRRQRVKKTTHSRERGKDLKGCGGRKRGSRERGGGEKWSKMEGSEERKTALDRKKVGNVEKGGELESGRGGEP